jgi:hypothetical protein
VRYDSFLEVGFEFFSVEIFLTAVTRTEVVNERTDFLSLSFLPGSLLDEGTERSSSSTETSHDDGLSVERRELNEKGESSIRGDRNDRKKRLTFITEGLTEAMTLSPGFNPAR